jgi:hypothetical protein
VGVTNASANWMFASVVLDVTLLCCQSWPKALSALFQVAGDGVSPSNDDPMVGAGAAGSISPDKESFRNLSSVAGFKKGEVDDHGDNMSNPMLLLTNPFAC